MDIDDLTDDDLDRLASKLAGRLPTGRHGEKIVTTRRQLLAAAAGGSAGVAALVKLGIDPATAQSAAGQVGTSSSPEDVYAYDLDVQNGAEFNGTDIEGVGALSTTNLDTGRTWQDVTGQRNIGETETNNTESEIIVNVVIESDDGDGSATGVRFDKPALDLARFKQEIDNGDSTTLITTVSPGEDYSVQNFTGSVTLRSWLEFRP
jgi:hypothetical protein